MSLTEHAILHRRVKSQHKGSVKEAHPKTDFVDHVIVSEFTANEINRDLFGTRVEGKVKVIVWGVEILTVQDKIEINGDEMNIGKGDLYEVTDVVKDNIRVANFAVYACKKLQRKVTP